jgi:excinuclease ABC subunit C
MVVFIDGQPAPSLYRHFNIKGPEKSDAHTMKEIITRRFNHPEWSFPGLIILDGGVPQLSIASSAIPPKIPILALAKRRETVYFYDHQKIHSLNLSIEDPVLNLLKSIRDEAHRFATTFHTKKRQRLLLS